MGCCSVCTSKDTVSWRADKGRTDHGACCLQAGWATGVHRLTKIRIKDELFLINLCSLVLILIISFADVEALRIVLGLPFLLFFPGYTLIAALFPRKSDIGTAERIALSIAFSVIVTPLIGVVLSLTWQIRLYPVLVAVAIFVAAMSTAAWYRRRGVAQEERLEVTLNLPFQRGGRLSVLDKVVSVILALVLLGAIATLGYVVASPRQGERFTEFYVLGAEERPTELAIGDEGIATLGIHNREGVSMTYAVDVMVGGSRLETTDPIELGPGKKWEGEVKFVPNDVCAYTQLAQDVSPADNSTQPEVKSVQVASVEHLQPGDQIWIGQESAVVREIIGHTVMLSEGLKQNHTAGTEVTEVQKLEFRLLKIRQVGEKGDTTISTWVGKDHLSATVFNQGGSQASYQIEVRVEGVQGKEEAIESVVQPVATGDEWAQEIEYPFSENYKIEFSLYRDGELWYRRLESESYPSLYMWIHVSGSEAGG
jgi:uncharacterized membrane protein